MSGKTLDVLDSEHSVEIPHWNPGQRCLTGATMFSGPIDLLVAGAPCQDFSVAGQRAGMDGARGNLSLRFVELVRTIRPRWLLFENVPGLLSSASHEAPSAGSPPDDLQPGEERIIEDDYETDEGSDFGYFLSALLELRYSLSYATLDAQYFGLAQRRDRLFVVGSLGDWCGPSAVLFDLESLSGNPAPSREKGKGVAGTISARTEGGGGLGTDFDLGGGLVTDPSWTGEREPQGGQRHLHPNHVTLPQRGGAKSNRRGERDIRGMTAVRRLTPLECTRLQGFADDFFDHVLYRGKPPADGPIYKALGNSMAVPVIAWIGKRIAQVDAIHSTLESEV